MTSAGSPPKPYENVKHNQTGPTFLDTINSANPPPEANTVPANPSILNAPTPATTGQSPHIKKEGAGAVVDATSGTVQGTTPTTQPQQQVVQPYSPYGGVGGMGGYGGYGGYGNMYGGMGGMMPGMYGAMGPMGPSMMQIGAQRIGYFSQLFQMASQSLAMTISSFAQFAMTFGQIGSLTGGSLAGLSLAGSLRILWEKLVAAYRHYMWIERYPPKSPTSAPSSPGGSPSVPSTGKKPDWLMISILTLAVVWLFKRLWRWLTKKPPSLPAAPPPGTQPAVAGAQPQPPMMPMMGGMGGYGGYGMSGYGGYGVGGMPGYGGYRPY